MIKFYQFLSNDAGAVTIDWVALTAGVLLLGILVVYAVFGRGVSPLVDSMNTALVGAAEQLDSVQFKKPTI